MANYLRTPDFAGQTLAAQGNIVKSAALAEQGRRDDRYSNALAQAYQGVSPQSYGGFEGTQIESIQKALAGASEQHRDMMMQRVNLLDYITQNVNPMNYAQMAGAAKQAMPDLQVPETFEEYQQVAPQLQNQVNVYKAAFGQPEEPYTLSPGAVRMSGGEEIAANPRQSETEQLSAQMAGMRLDKMKEEKAARADEAVATKEAAETAKQTEIAQVQSVIGEIDRAYNDIDSWNATGLSGALFGWVPGSKGMELRETIKTIQANLGFDRLQQMRDASPTGGALGQVSERELAFLQATLTSLNPNMSSERLSQSLDKAKQHYMNWKMTLIGINPDDSEEEQGSGGRRQRGQMGRRNATSWEDLPDGG